ncbi:MAG: hypothetical protein ABL958_17735, partial [Bdellovibrionia bacterium]
ATLESHATGRRRIVIGRALLVFAFVIVPSLSFAAMMTDEAEVELSPLPGWSGTQLTVRGTAGSSQIFARVRAINCGTYRKTGPSEMTKNNCRKPVFFGLNVTTEVEPGFYLLGFENSIYPGFVEVKANESTVIDLARIEIPKAAKTAKVYRDFTRLVEQRKQYFSVWATGLGFFQQTEYQFGDFYITQWPERPAIPNLIYDYCERKSPSLSEEAVDICKAWNSASFIEMMDLFEFDTRGRFKQFWVGRPGGVFKFLNKRHLVAAPTQGGDFVSVFPGNYAIEYKNVDGKVRTSQLTAGTVTENYGVVPEHPLLKQPAAVDPFDPAALAQTLGLDLAPTSVPQISVCGLVRLWKTEARSYCRRDTDEGCDRAKAAACQPMIDRGL